ncbi:MAG: hypothetical protein QG628_276 [Patescibacteria group bacterium]|nr:hypothetical protein [Patescibacteria group bacterium]
MKYKQLKNQQQGLVSILVTMIFLIVLSLIVVGFAQVARREQRQALDRQLSSQAFYAAESGINQAKNRINGTPDGGNIYSKYNSVPSDKPDCNTDPASAPTPQFNYDLGNSVKYSCLLIDQTPEVLEWASIDPSKSTVVPVKAFNSTGDPATFTELEFQWQNNDGSGDSFRDNSDFPPFAEWDSGNNAAPVLRVDLTRIPDPISTMDRDYLLQNTATIFFRPSGNTASTDTVTFAGASDNNQGAIVKTRCDNNPIASEKKCKATVTGLNSHEYSMRVKTVYKNALVSMSGQAINPVTGLPIPAEIGGAQAEIDSTGKAADILKRIRVKIPYNNTKFNYPEGVTESGDVICKRLSVTPDTTTSDCTGPVTNPVTTVTLPVTPNPDTGGAGNSQFASCLAQECGTGTGGPAPPAYRWKYTFFNTSGNPSNIVKSCRWNWGDGSPDKVGTPSKSSDACLDKQWTSHTFPVLQSPLKCRIYKVTLTVTFNNGFAAKDYTSKSYVPNGTNGSVECKGKYVTYTP